MLRSVGKSFLYICIIFCILLTIKFPNTSPSGCSQDSTTCNGTDPTSGTHMETITADSCDGTAAGATCAHTCATNYEAGSVTCTAGTPGTWTVVDCTPIVCSTPTTSGYLAPTAVAGLVLSGTNAFAITINTIDNGCDTAAGWSGTAAATACSASGPYTFRFEGGTVESGEL